MISIEAEKILHKFQHPIMIKTLQKVDMEGTYPNMIKATDVKHTVNIRVPMARPSKILRDISDINYGL